MCLEEPPVPLAKEEQQLLLTSLATALRKRWTSGSGQEGGGVWGVGDGDREIRVGRWVGGIIKVLAIITLEKFWGTENCMMVLWATMSIASLLSPPTLFLLACQPVATAASQIKSSNLCKGNSKAVLKQFSFWLQLIRFSLSFPPSLVLEYTHWQHECTQHAGMRKQILTKNVSGKSIELTMERQANFQYVSFTRVSEYILCVWCRCLLRTLELRGCNPARNGATVYWGLASCHTI